jgi:hypothetical protein
MTDRRITVPDIVVNINTHMLSECEVWSHQETKLPIVLGEKKMLLVGRGVESPFLENLRRRGTHLDATSYHLTFLVRPGFPHQKPVNLHRVGYQGDALVQQLQDLVVGLAFGEQQDGEASFRAFQSARRSRVNDARQNPRLG